MRRAVAIIMAITALFTTVGQAQAFAMDDPDATVWGWIPAAVFWWLAYLNFKPARRIRRGPTPPVDP